MAYILCAEDDESVSNLVRHILKMAGHEVEVAANGREALKCVEQTEPDLILLDWSMPYLTGPSVCQQIKSNPFLSRIPVLMLTAQTSIEDKVYGFEMGADDFLAKPFEPRELTARVNALLRLVQREGDRNPSSGLPGGHALGKHIEERLGGGGTFAIIYLDLDHFKPFADTFGFGAADAVISKMGAMIGQLAMEFHAFAGHIGGDDFLLVANMDEAQAMVDKTIIKYADLVKEIVGPKLAAAQKFTGLDRDGQPREFRLASLTAVILPVDPATWISLAHLGEAAATWKKAARLKGQSNSVLAEI